MEDDEMGVWCVEVGEIEKVGFLETARSVKKCKCYC